MFDHVQRGWLGGDDYRVAADAAGVVELPDSPDSTDGPDRGASVGGTTRPVVHGAAAPHDLTGLLAEAPPEVWGRTVLAVAAMHEPDRHGRCRYCRPDRRRWRRRHGPIPPCPTRRMLLAEATSAQDGGPRWTPA